MSFALAEQIVKVLSDKKAQNIELIDIRDVSQIADYFVICSGTSTTQVKALADELDFQIGRQADIGQHKEGYGTASWILIDYKDVIVHIFCGETRDFYNLEHLWSDGKKVDISAILEG